LKKQNILINQTVLVYGTVAKYFSKFQGSFRPSHARVY